MIQVPNRVDYLESNTKTLPTRNNYVVDWIMIDTKLLSEIYYGLFYNQQNNFVLL